MNQAWHSRRAFTLIELLVVIAIIAILAAILFPVFAQAKASAKTTVTISNLKQSCLAVLMYCNDYDDTTPGAYMCPGYNATTNYFCSNPTNEWYDSNSNLFTTWSDNVYPYAKNGGIFMDDSNVPPLATPPPPGPLYPTPTPHYVNWATSTTIGANRLGFFDHDGYNGSTYSVEIGRVLTAQNDLSGRAMLSTTQDPQSGFTNYGNFYYDNWLAANPDYLTSGGAYWSDIVWLSTNLHANHIPTAYGDGHAKSVPWGSVADPVGWPNWWQSNYTYWGAPQSPN